MGIVTFQGMGQILVSLNKGTGQKMGSKTIISWGG